MTTSHSVFEGNRIFNLVKGDKRQDINDTASQGNKMGITLPKLNTGSLLTNPLFSRQMGTKSIADQQSLRSRTSTNKGGPLSSRPWMLFKCMGSMYGSKVLSNM